MQNASALNIEQITLGEVKDQFSVRDLSSGWRILALALLLGAAADVLFYKQALGLNAPLFGALVLGALLFAFERSGQHVRLMRRNLWLALPILFFATTIFLRDEPFLTFLNLVATLALLGLLFFTLGTNPLERLTVMAYPLSVFVGGLLAAVSVIPLIAFVLSRLTANRGRWQGLWRVLLGLGIALPFLVIFAALFAAADAIFSQVMRNLLNLDLLKNLPDLIAQLIWIGFVSWLSAGALLMALDRARKANGILNLEKPWTPILKLGFVEATTVLASVNALFALFVAIQFTYLFGGSANINVAGFTYADYARRGFFELVAVAVVTMGLLLALDWVARREGRMQTIAFKLLSLLLIALVLVMLASAFQRMSLYESAYGFTSLRLYTHWFMLWMGAVFMLKAAALWLARGQIFAFGSFLSLIVSLVGFNLLNPDAFIAEQNVKRYLETGKLDADYAIAMSADATPVFAAHFDELKPDAQAKLGGGLRYQKDQLYGSLSRAGWQSYHAARKQAIDALVAKQDALNQYAPIRPRFRGID